MYNSGMSVEDGKKSIHIVKVGPIGQVPERRVNGRHNSSLSPEALKALRELIDKGEIPTQGTFVLYSSGAPDALDFAKAVRESTGAKSRIDQRLRERSHGVWEGKDVALLEKTFGKEWYLQRPLRAEPYASLKERVAGAFNDVVNDSQMFGTKGSSIVFTHEGPMGVILEMIGEKPTLGYELPHGAVVTLQGSTAERIENYKRATTELTPRGITGLKK